MAKLSKKAGGYKKPIKEIPYFTGKEAEKPLQRELKHDATAYSDEVKDVAKGIDQAINVGLDFNKEPYTSTYILPPICEPGSLTDGVVIDPPSIEDAPFTMHRPIAFIDVETTGTDTNVDRIVEISVLVLYPDMHEEVKTRYINPGIPIPKEATLIHGIDDEMVKDAPPFSKIATSLHELIQDCDIAGFNSTHFDCPILWEEFTRAGINWKFRGLNFIDVRTIYVINEPRTLAAAYKFYTGKELHNAHSAEGDIRATKEILLKQIEMYPELPQNYKELAIYSNYGKPILDIAGKFTLDAEGDIIFAFGKHIGKKAKRIAYTDKNYMDWVQKSPTFSEDTKAVARVATFGKTIAL